MSEHAEIPVHARHTCKKCGFAVAWVTTSRKSKGAYVEIEIDAAPDPGGTVMAQMSGGVLYGNPVTRTMAASVRAAGRPLYGEHKMTCPKRNGTHKK